jgi:hypothetical protein
MRSAPPRAAGVNEYGRRRNATDKILSQHSFVSFRASPSDEIVQPQKSELVHMMVREVYMYGRVYIVELERGPTRYSTIVV